MGGCCFPGCSNTHRKGFKLHRFPANPIRHKKWVENCGRLHWKPTKTSCLCSSHFDENQYERYRLDGLQKLKPNAVPTIFPHVMRLRSKEKRGSSGSVLASQKNIQKHTDTTKSKDGGEKNSEEHKVLNKRKLRTPTKIPRQDEPKRDSRSNKRRKTDVLRDAARNFQILNGNKELPPDLKIFYRSPFEAMMTPQTEHGYARVLPLTKTNQKQDQEDRELPVQNNIEVVEVCFNSETNQDDCIEPERNCTVDETLDENGNIISNETVECHNCEELSTRVQELEKKIFCMNSAMRMVLDKPGRNTFRSLVSTIMCNLQSDDFQF